MLYYSYIDHTSSLLCLADFLFAHIPVLSCVSLPTQSAAFSMLNSCHISKIRQISDFTIYTQASEPQLLPPFPGEVSYHIHQYHLGKYDEQTDKEKQEEQKSKLCSRDRYLVSFLLGFQPYESRSFLLDLLGHIHIIHGIDHFCKRW